MSKWIKITIFLTAFFFLTGQSFSTLNLAPDLKETTCLGATRLHECENSRVFMLPVYGTRPEKEKQGQSVKKNSDFEERNVWHPHKVNQLVLHTNATTHTSI